jgi:hypothetical protein
MRGLLKSSTPTGSWHAAITRIFPVTSGALRFSKCLERTKYFAIRLGDEVAIDFPSVASVLDRMRDSFFGDARESFLSAEVVVSPQEAFWGVLVPLHVPLRRTCTRCGGRGEIWSELCLGCCGAGEIPADHEMRLRVPAGVREGATFRFSVAPQGAPQTFVEVRVTIR